MNQFSIGAAWSHGVAFLQEHLMLLLAYVGGSVVLGSAVQLFVFGINPETLAAQVTAMQGTSPETILTTMLPALLGGVLSAALIQGAGQTAAYRAVLSDERDAAGLLTYGLIVTVISLLFWMVVGFGVAIILGLLFAVLGVGAASFSTGAGVGMILLLLLIALPAFLWLATRLWVMQAAMADARSVNPLYGLAQAWQLSSGSNQWPMLGYLLLLIVAAVVIFGIIGGVGGLLFGMIGGNVGAFLSALLTGIPTGILGVALNAGVYRALRPAAHADVFA